MDEHIEIVRLNREFYDHNPEALKTFNKASWNKPFEAYIRLNLKRCRQHLPPDQGNLNILDIGTGQGHILPYLAEMTDMERIHALDVSHVNLSIARNRFPGVQFHQSDFVRDFIPAKQFDLITAFSVLHHIVDWRGFLTKASESLVPGGVLYIDHDPMRSLVSRIYTALWKIRHHGERETIRMEYHAFSEKGFDPLRIVQELEANFKVQLAYCNVGLIQEVFKLTGINLWHIIPSELLIDKAWKIRLHPMFMYFRIIARKKHLGESY